MSKLAINGGPAVAADFRVPEWPIITDSDRKAVLEALESGKWCRLVPNSRAESFERVFAEYQDAKYGIAVNNGTVALELALLAAGVRPGDEVLVPAVTFIASATAVVRVGAIPVFVDSDPDTISISASAAEKAITPRTRACVAVHYGGYPVDFDALLPILEKHGLRLIEDCAHAQGTEWRGKKVGARKDLAAFSFQQSKSLTAGEGGMVLTNDGSLAEQAMLYHNIGRLLGRPGYEHFVVASNYRMPEISAALLLSQFSRLQEQVARRMEGAEFLANGFQAIGGIKPLKKDARITQRGYYFMVLRYNKKQFGNVPLEKFINALRAEGVPCGSGYGLPICRQPAFRREHVAELLGLEPAEVPDYPNMHLPVAEKFCYEEQITIQHEVLLAEKPDLQLILDATEKIKANPQELVGQP
jgi:dTDP-4-amino-4,6-dideoxygalactose transaminase